MKKTAVVTGVAGFIGSHIAERLLKDYYVIGIDCFTDFYSKRLKMRNLENLRASENFEFVGQDLAKVGLGQIKGDVVFHEAGQPGVRTSWKENFDDYVKNNIIATQRVLEACTRSPPQKLVFASSSSVYGNIGKQPAIEEQVPKPVSPYGVTKLAAENLCNVYWRNFGVPVVSLRYFTAYGPRQRPDMAINKFVTAAMNGRPITVCGDGSQSRDFTYISDIVEANMLAARNSVEGEVFNVGSGKPVTINLLIDLIGDIVGKKVKKIFRPRVKGDADATHASVEKAKCFLGFEPQIPLRKGLISYVDWMKSK